MARFTLKDIFLCSWRIRDIFVRDSICLLPTDARIRNNGVPVWSRVWRLCIRNVRILFCTRMKVLELSGVRNARESKYPECNKSRNIYEPGKISSDANLVYSNLSIPLKFPPVYSFLCFSNNYEPSRVGIYTSVQCTSHELPHLENPLAAQG